MRTGLAVLMVGVAMATAWGAANALHTIPPQPGVDREITTASIERPKGQVFSLNSAAAGEACLIVKGEALSSGFSEIKVNPTCDRIMPGLSNARFWKDRPDGSVAFTADSSVSIVEFAAGDGVEYEAYSPSAAMLTLKSQK